MLFFFLGGGCGPSMHCRSADSTPAHVEEAKPVEAQHAAKNALVEYQTVSTRHLPVRECLLGSAQLLITFSQLSSS